MTGTWRERFDTLVERKTREAAGASLHPYVTESEHPPERATVIGNDWSRRLFGGGFHVSPARMAQRPACSLVFVQSADGNTGASDPGALGGGETDKHLIYEGLSRVGADGVLAGAETVRDANLVFSVWHPELVALRASLGLPRHPVQIIATLKGLDLEGSLLFNVPEIPVVLLTVAPAARTMQASLGARPWVTALVMNEPAALPASRCDRRGSRVCRASAAARSRVSCSTHTSLTRCISPPRRARAGIPARRSIRGHGAAPSPSANTAPVPKRASCSSTCSRRISRARSVADDGDFMIED
jgi:hypothetical protein